MVISKQFKICDFWDYTIGKQKKRTEQSYTISFSSDEFLFFFSWLNSIKWKFSFWQMYLLFHSSLRNILTIPIAFALWTKESITPVHSNWLIVLWR